MIRNTRQRGVQTRGFTLVETLVAVLILSMVIIGPITIAQRGVQNADYANEEAAAVFLAQEAQEAARVLRDNNALEAYNNISGFPTDTWGWYGLLVADCTNGNGCGYNPVTQQFLSCGALNNCELLRDANGYYSYDVGGTNSGFVRKTYFGALSSGGISVRTEITWSPRAFGGSMRTINLQTWLYDHYERYGI